MRIETVTLRSQNAELCIYDKRAQVYQSDQLYFLTFHEYVMRDSKMPEHLTRVEFRFRREMLARYGIDTFQQLRESQEALPQVFGRDWFRILERDKVRGYENFLIRGQP